MALRERPIFCFFATLQRAAPGLATLWWALLLLRGMLPALLALASGALISAVAHGTGHGKALAVVGTLFVLLQVTAPIHQACSANLGARAAGHLYHVLIDACVRPAGLAHLEDAELNKDLTVGRDFDLGVTGPPLVIAMDFIARGFLLLITGVASAVVLCGYALWAGPLLAAAWSATHVLLRESAVWKDRNTDEVRSAQQHADYTFRLAVDAAPAKELRLFGLGDWVMERFVARRTRLYELQWQATRLRERSVLGALAVVLVANAVVFGSLGLALLDGRLELAAASVYLQSAVGCSAIAFGGLSWALDGAAAPALAVAKLGPAMARRGALASGQQAANALPQHAIRFRDVTFRYAADQAPVLDHFDLTIPAGSSLAIVGQNALHRRHGRHLFLLGTTASAGKELRVHDLGAFVVERLQASWDSWYAAVGRTRWISGLWHAAAWGLFGAAYAGALVWLSNGAHATVGALLLVLAAGSQLFQYVGAVIGELGFLRGIWLGSAQRLAWLEDYAQATSSHARVTAPERIARGIRFDRVSFRYPGTTRLVLDAVSLELPAGAIVAVVGENGAGKSTLVKLLCRLYAPTDGRIEVDGVDLATLSVEGWRARLAGAFQDFFRFELQAHHSVGLGELARMDERRVVQTAVERGGAQDVIQKLDSGLDTQLGPSWSGGAELSFGQWQKLALARGFMRDEPLLLVLDEPTAALDAETEHALFERFAAAARGTSGNGRIALLVSHRFSTVRMADLIVVLDGSKVVEVGSHDDLMAKHGQYAELYAIQAAALS